MASPADHLFGTVEVIPICVPCGHGHHEHEDCADHDWMEACLPVGTRCPEGRAP